MLKTSTDEGPDSQCDCERNALTSPAPPVLAAPPLLPPPSTRAGDWEGLRISDSSLGTLTSPRDTRPQRSGRAASVTLLSRSQG